MASFSLVHGAWHGGWCWDPVRAELEARGHGVHTPDLPCEDSAAGVTEYAAAVPAADVVVGHSLGGFTIPLVQARTHVFLARRRGRHRRADRLGAWLRRRPEARRARPLVLPRSRGGRSRAPVPVRARGAGVEAPPAGSARPRDGPRRAPGLHRLRPGRRDPARLAAAPRPRRPRCGTPRARLGSLADARVPA